jgi:hypothetical protein
MPLGTKGTEPVEWPQQLFYVDSKVFPSFKKLTLTYSSGGAMTFTRTALGRVECQHLHNILLRVILLNVVLLSVILLNVPLLSNILMNVVLISIILVSIVLISVILLIAMLLSAILQCV